MNGTEYKLDSDAEVWKEMTIVVEITTNNIKIEIGSDTVASYYISDLMVATGTEKVYGHKMQTRQEQILSKLEKVYK